MSDHTHPHSKEAQHTHEHKAHGDSKPHGHEHTHGSFLTQSNGLKMPILGLGTYDNYHGDDLVLFKRLIKEKVYTLIDTASYYKNEESIGKALQELIAEGSITRDDVYITTKAFMYEMDDIEGALRRSLAKLQVKQVDLFLVHWPLQTVGNDLENAKPIRIPMYKIWAEFERMVELGLTKSIGVSNFNFQLLNDLLSYAKIKPVTNQIELHPYLSQHRFVESMKSNGIIPTAYSPLARGGTEEGVPLTDPVILQIAKELGKSPGQIILAWHVARGHAIIPKSAKYERAIENAEALKIKLSPEQVKQIDGINRNKRILDPSVWFENYKFCPIFE